jgi:hypothetical protein
MLTDMVILDLDPGYPIIARLLKIAIPFFISAVEEPE